MVIPSMKNSTQTTSINDGSAIVMFGIPTIIILLLSIFVIVITIYRYYNSKRHVLPRFEIAEVTTATLPQGSV
jgi:hypothetical protein